MKNRYLRLSALLACCLWLSIQAAQAQADRDIVYSARYYNPPTRKGISHWHLYRINADGTGRRQITFGKLDDSWPLWSPDGKQIAFIRTLEKNDNRHQTLCLIGADGGTVRLMVDLGTDDWSQNAYNWIEQMAWSPNSQFIEIVVGHAQPPNQLILLTVKTDRTRTIRDISQVAWSPDGRKLYLDDGRILDPVTGQTLSKTRTLSCATWPTHDSVLGLQDGPGSTPFLCLVDLAGHERKRTLIVDEAQDTDKYDITMNVPLLMRSAPLLPSPLDPHTLVLGPDNSNSSVRPQNLYYRIDALTGKAHLFAEGQFFCFAPDGTQFLTAPGRDLGPYGKNSEGKPRTVWISNLQIGSMPDGKLKVITPGTVWVLGADCGAVIKRFIRP